jgi:hypothetical protein
MVATLCMVVKSIMVQLFKCSERNGDPWPTLDGDLGSKFVGTNLNSFEAN